MKRRGVLFAFVLSLIFSRSGLAATDCPINPDGFYPTQADYLASGLACSQFTSRFDGATDYFWIGYPKGFDATKPVNLILWFRALGQSDGALSDGRMFFGDSASNFPGLTNLYNAIVIGMGQRGTTSGDNTCSFLGDFHNTAANPGFCPEPLSNAPRDAAKADVRELINQLASRFKINHVFAAGASMGGYAALRLLQLYPDVFSGAITAATALCPQSDSGPPNCTGGWAPAGSKAIYDAASAGAFNDKLVYVAVGANDATDILTGTGYFDGLMTGKTWYHHSLVSGRGHENFLADDYNTSVSGKTAWMIDNPAVPALQENIQSYISSHSKSPLTPSSGWVAPANAKESYLSDRAALGVAGSSPGAGSSSGGGSSATSGTSAGTGGSSSGAATGSGGCSLLP